MQIVRVSRVCINSLPLSNVGMGCLSRSRPVFLALYQGWLVRPVNRTGRVKTRGILVYICMYRAYVGMLCE